jgi:hypothetical protein
MRVDTIATVSKQMTDAGFVTEASRIGSVSFDSMKLREGIKFNLHTGEFCGIDPHTKFDFISRELRGLAKAQVSRNQTSVFSFFLLSLNLLHLPLHPDRGWQGF